MTATDGAGNASIPLPISSQPALAGLELYGQWVVADPLGAFSLAGLSFSLSNARMVVLR